MFKTTKIKKMEIRAYGIEICNLVTSKLFLGTKYHNVYQKLRNHQTIYTSQVVQRVSNLILPNM